MDVLGFKENIKLLHSYKVFLLVFLQACHLKLCLTWFTKPCLGMA